MANTVKVLVWDIPTRLFHWLLAAAFLGAWLTADSERWRLIHVTLGYSVFGLIGFRLFWGLIGSRYARFRSFLFNPSETWAYLKSMLANRPAHYLGHNPAGALAIFGLLGLGLATAGSGIAMDYELGGEWLEEFHEIAANGMLVLVLAHIAGVVLGSLQHRENLARAMVTGYKQGEAGSGIRRGHAGVGLLLAAVVAAYWAVYPSAATPPVEGGQTEALQGEHDD
ncbi:MAG: cytochrome b/b6 domain-containing protein [Pseudomonadota bacterium]